MLAGAVHTIDSWEGFLDFLEAINMAERFRLPWRL
jgi:hypothetical protein